MQLVLGENNLQFIGDSNSQINRYRETLYYNESNLITKIIDPEGNSTEYEYNEFEEPIMITNAVGGKTLFCYNDKGNIVEYVEPSGARTEYSYKDDKITKVKYPNGGETKWEYNNKGEIDKIIYPDETESNYVYNDYNLLSGIKDSMENETTIEYDECGNVTNLIHPDRSKTYWEYDKRGNCVKIVNAENLKQVLVYDKLDRIVRAELPDGNSIHYKYDSCDNVVAVKDKQRAVSFEYTRTGKIKKRIEQNRILEFVYDTQEQVTSIINEKGERYRFEYDGNGNIVKEIGFDGLEYRYIFDKDGRAVKIIQPDNNEQILDYDISGNVIKAIYHDGYKEEFKYNLMGSLTEAKNNYSTIKFDFNIMDRIEKVIQDGQVIQYKYNRLGQKIEMGSSVGICVKQEYNKLGEVSEIQAKFRNDSSWISKMKYNGTKQETERTMPGGVSMLWEYDKAGQPVVQSISGRDSRKKIRKYSWDINNQLKSIAYLGKEQKYTYDKFGNLSYSNFEAETVFRCIDSVGNVYQTKDQKDRNYGEGGQLLKSHTAEYEYDTMGNLIKKTTKEGIWKYLYYSNGLMQKVVRPDGKEVSFKYDGLGRRIEKVFDGKIKKFLWDGDTLLHEWDEVDKVIDNEKTWIFKNDELIPIAQITKNKRYSIIADHLGTPIEMYDEIGEKTWSSELDIYGRTKKQEGDYDSCLFRYPGQYEDVETGLYYNRFRYYSPTDGIYTQQDPIGTNGGMVLYGYVSDTNVMADVFGLIPKLPMKSGVDLSGLNLITYKPTKVTPMPGARETGISRAWKLEHELANKTERGTYPWSRNQLSELKNTGKVGGFTGHHINNKANGKLGNAFKRDPRNIRFLLNSSTPYDEHIYGERGHRGSYRNNTKGRLIDRQAMIDAAQKRKG